MTEKVLLNSGYKLFEMEHQKNCDRFYQKKIDDKRHFNIYYYDTFKENGALDYNFEYELYEERDNYVITKYIYGLDKDCSYTIEEIENILLGGKNE
jgi:hypothetical protein